jgi:hypothetical protein
LPNDLAAVAERQSFGTPLAFASRRGWFMPGRRALSGRPFWFLLLFKRLDQRVIELKPFQDIKHALRNDQSDFARQTEIIVSWSSCDLEPHEPWELRIGMEFPEWVRCCNFDVCKARARRTDFQEPVHSILGDNEAWETRQEHIAVPTSDFIVKVAHDWRMHAPIHNGIGTLTTTRDFWFYGEIAHLAT